MSSNSSSSITLSIEHWNIILKLFQMHYNVYVHQEEEVDGKHVWDQVLLKTEYFEILLTISLILGGG